MIAIILVVVGLLFTIYIGLEAVASTSYALMLLSLAIAVWYGYAICFMMG